MNKLIVLLFLSIHTSFLFACNESEINTYKPTLKLNSGSLRVYLPTKHNGLQLASASVKLMDETGKIILFLVPLKLINLIELDEHFKDYHLASMVVADNLLVDTIITAAYEKDTGDSGSYLCKDYKTINVRDYLKK